MPLSDDELQAQAAELCAGAADDFLFAYLVLSPATNGAITSRLFIMAHCIELSIKAALFAKGLDASKFNHELEAMLKKDAALWTTLKPLMPSKEAREAFRRPK